jgi:hypothetical protein
MLVLNIAFLLCLFASVKGFQNPCDDGFIPFPNSNREKYDCVSNAEAYASAMQYLEKNLPSFDVPKQTLWMVLTLESQIMERISLSV